MTGVLVCPCGADLVDEGFAFWCPACQEPVPFSAAIIDPDPDTERDAMIDAREAASDGL